LIVICCNEVTNFLIPSVGNEFVTIMKDVTITDDYLNENQKFLTEYYYLLNMHKTITYNN